MIVEYYLWVLAKFIAGFMIIATHMYLSGRTQITQMTAIDLIGNFILGGVIGGVIYTDTIPFRQYVVVLLLGVLLIYILNLAAKHVQIFRGFAIGSPIAIIKDGRFVVENIVNNKHKIDMLRVASQMHSKGALSFEVVHYAQIEPGGELTVICNKDDMPSVVLMFGSEPRIAQLESIERESEWLFQALKDMEVSIEDVFLVEFWRESLYVTKKSGVKIVGRAQENDG